MENFTFGRKPSKEIIDSIRNCVGIMTLADFIYPGKYTSPISCPDGLTPYYVDLLAEYGPSCRIVFLVRNEQEILGRIAIVEGMSE